MSEGATAAMVVRPERMRIVRDVVETSEANHVRAVVTNVAYFGAFRRIAIRFSDGSSGLLHDSVDAPSPVALGDTVTVGWEAHDAVVVDASEVKA
jgi:putative spermidine/putrescine transport system ATP-binding protein